MLIWVIIPHLEGWAVINTKNILWFSILFQYLARVYLVFPLSSQIEATGIMMQTAWAGAAYNLLLFMLAGHVSKNFLIILSLIRISLQFSVSLRYSPSLEIVYQLGILCIIASAK